jgi:succinate dehydrogenase/fumarate reductase iron-sulfur protein
MQVALKIWRYDAATGDRALREYEVDVSEEATLLDTLDAVKDKVDGSLAYRKSCRMMICGSCGMRMDGGAVLACKTRMYEISKAGHVPVISACRQAFALHRPSSSFPSSQHSCSCRCSWVRRRLRTA